MLSSYIIDYIGSFLMLSGEIVIFAAILRRLDDEVGQ